MKKIVIINGHPYEDSIGSAIQNAYAKGAVQAGHEVQIVQIRDLNFNYNLPEGYRRLPEPESDILMVQDLIRQSDHMVFIYPNWWGTYPSMFKGFIDRIFVPGFAFKFANGGSRKKLLSGKSARIFITMDDPVWYYNFILGAPGSKALKKATLQFCGVSPVRITALGKIRKLKEYEVERILGQCRLLGSKGL